MSYSLGMLPVLAATSYSFICAACGLFWAATSYEFICAACGLCWAATSYEFCGWPLAAVSTRVLPGRVGPCQRRRGLPAGARVVCRHSCAQRGSSRGVVRLRITAGEVWCASALLQGRCTRVGQRGYGALRQLRRGVP